MNVHFEPIVPRQRDVEFVQFLREMEALHGDILRWFMVPPEVLGVHESTKPPRRPDGRLDRVPETQ